MKAVVVDTSAVMAILLEEPGAQEVAQAMADAGRRVMSTATLVEVGIVVESRFGPAGRGIVDQFLRDAEVDVVELDRYGADRAVDGWRRFGKDRHRAGLNFGDCFAYGLAVGMGGPVLCTGKDFAATDVAVVPGVNDQSS